MQNCTIFKVTKRCVASYMAQLFRPSEIVLDILTEGQKGAFTKEDSEKVIDETEKRGSGLSNLPTSEYRTPVYTMWASALRSEQTVKFSCLI